MPRPRDRRNDMNHPHTQKAWARTLRRLQRAKAKEPSFAAVPTISREEYEALQARLPVADRVPW